MAESYLMPMPTAIPIDEVLLWTKIGAIGTLVGSAFSFIAIIISIVAFFYPRKIKIDASIATSFMLSQVPGVERIDTYTIKVRNLSAKAITVNNVYLNFGGKKNGIVFLGMLNEGSLLQVHTVRFPKRLEPGESFDYYLLQKKLDKALAEIAKEPDESKLYIVVDEVTKGSKYISTRWKLKTFTQRAGKEPES